MDNYKLPENTRIGHVHLKVADLQRSLDFYHKLLGFEIITTMGDQAAFISAGGYHHHIGLNTWHSKNGPQPPKNSTGLYHTAILYPTRKDLARILKRLMDGGQQLTGAADHGVSEALYLNDPDGNGVELYWDRPRADWPKEPNGDIKMYTKFLNLQDLLKELEH
ncbi:VOC family protein [Allomuricauda sp. NBRC 101325]|uniref:VOC family protein n=1 Tax=Allomuricauda sp. NBRC 101325 TaxID=1113758 RepID=UPI0024A42D5E|nr:VOC family protein [Muricauda sp. NBRC 101325]GLU44370.1 glyoxalase [Muricauda sp. NBRC 101325]